MPLTNAEKMHVEIEAAWGNFSLGPVTQLKQIECVDPLLILVVKHAYHAGYLTGARNTYREILEGPLYECI